MGYASTFIAVAEDCLAKTFGWGFHFDSDGRITLYAVDSPEYRRLSSDPELSQLRAMRSRRSRG